MLPCRLLFVFSAIETIWSTDRYHTKNLYPSTSTLHIYVRCFMKCIYLFTIGDAAMSPIPHNWFVLGAGIIRDPSYTLCEEVIRLALNRRSVWVLPCTNKGRSYRRTFCLNFQIFFSRNFLCLYIFHFFFSSRRRHTRLPLVSWARRCV